jgi:FtsH-binding integral membrane protein
MNLIYLFLLLPFFIYWCISEKVGLQLGIVVILCIWTVLLYWYFKEKISLDIDFTWIIIAVIFCVCLFLGKKLNRLLSKGGLRAYIITSAVVSFLMILFRPSYEYVFPGGIMLGLCIGYCLNKRYIGFKSSDVLNRKGIIKWLTLLARFILGIAVIAGILFRVNEIMRQISNSQYILIYGFLCYAIISLWVSVAAPWLFIKIRLAGVDANDSTEQNDKRQ